MNNHAELLLEKIDYRFDDPHLFDQALTHCSFGAANNERLEFLGDAVLGMVISDILYGRFPQASEGELSQLRASLVKALCLPRWRANSGLANVSTWVMASSKLGVVNAPRFLQIRSRP